MRDCNKNTFFLMELLKLPFKIIRTRRYMKMLTYCKSKKKYRLKSIATYKYQFSLSFVCYCNIQTSTLLQSTRTPQDHVPWPRSTRWLPYITDYYRIKTIIIIYYYLLRPVVWDTVTVNATGCGFDSH